MAGQATGFGKRGLVGVYQHMDQKHLERYLAEFVFRFDNHAALKVNDALRADICCVAAGQRLTY